MIKSYHQINFSHIRTNLGLHFYSSNTCIAFILLGLRQLQYIIKDIKNYEKQSRMGIKISRDQRNKGATRLL